MSDNKSPQPALTVDYPIFMGMQQATMQAAIFALIRLHPDPKALKEDWLAYTSKRLSEWASAATSANAPGYGSKEMQLTRGRWEGVFDAAIANRSELR